MTAFYTALFFLFGMLFGSFYNVVGLRIPNRESIIFPPSHCPVCKTRLTASQLFPVLSFCILKGRCRTCQASISPIYPVMELIAGVSFALVFLFHGFTWKTIAGLLLASLLLIVSVSDIAYRIIPDRVVLPFLGLFLLLRFFYHPDYSFANHLIAMALGFGLFLLLAVLSNGGVGGGDIKLYAVVGLFLGTPLLVLTILLSTLFGTSYGLLSLLLKGGGRNTAIPFGPFIALGAMISCLFGEGMIKWYVEHFF